MLPVKPYIEGVLWTLPIEISFYALVFLLIYKGLFRYIGLLAAIIGSYSAAYWVVYGVAVMTPSLSFLASKLGYLSDGMLIQLSLVHHGCFFAIGVFLWLTLVKHSHTHYLFLLPFLFVGCFFEIYFFNSTRIEATNILQPPLVPFIIWLACVGLMVLSVLYNRQLSQILPQRSVRWLGQMTYPLYLLHRPVAYMVIYGLSLAHAGQYKAWVAGFGAAWIAAALVTTYMEPWLKIRTRNAVDKLYMLLLQPLSRRFSSAT